jgi:hypothetical protein
VTLAVAPGERERSRENAENTSRLARNWPMMEVPLIVVR